MIMNTNTHKLLKRLLAMALSFAMLLSILPTTALAESGACAIGVSGEIIAFEPLTEAVAKQAVPLGTSLNKLNLPESLMATVRVAMAVDAAVPETTEPVAEPDASGPHTQEPPKIEAPQITEKTIPVPVTWVSEPEFDGEKAGAYIFTANVEGFIVSAALPAISVTVGKSTGTVTAFAELSDEIRWQNTAQPVFPETVSGTVYGKPAEIPVTWQTEQDYDEDFPQRGLYVFDALPGEGYAMADGVEALRITVYIPAQRMIMRMGGSGTDTSPLEITTAAQLAELAVLVNAGRLEDFLLNGTGNVSLKLINDLDLSAYGQSYNGGQGWIPIGGYDTQPFMGHFDGNHKTITGLYISDNTLDGVGLFGYIDEGEVRDLGVIGIDIVGHDYVGGVAGYVYGEYSKVQNCYITGRISGANGVGGVLGITYGTVENCYGTGTVSGISSAGGIAGIVSGMVQNCYATGTVSGDNYVGGVAGNVYGVVANCYATGTVTGTGYVGGAAGLVYGTVQNCYATGTISGSDYVGGVVSSVLSDGEVQNCAALNQSISGEGDIGRVVGAKDTANLANNYAFIGMRVNNFVVPCGAADNENGANLTVSQINAAFFWTAASNWEGAGWNTTVWTITSGKLPTLTGLAGQSGGGGLYLTEGDLQYATVTVNGSYVYTGLPITPDLMVSFDGATLVKDMDYTATYSDNTNAGQATVTLSGIGNFTGTKAANFTIQPKALTTAVLTVLGGPFTYSGKQHKPNVTITCDGKTLTLDEDYEVTYGCNINAGTTVFVSASGKGNYSGYAGTNPFTISRAELTVNGIAAKTYDGTTGASGLALIFQGLQNGEELGLGIDYGVAGMSFNSADAGSDKTATGMVALNYTTKANNYFLANGTLSLTGQTINKAPVSDVTMPVYVPKNCAATLTTSEQQVSAVLNDLTKKDLGSITWSIVSVDNDDAVLAATPSIGVVNFPLSIDIASVADAGKTATIKVTVSSTNYADFAASMIVTVTEKTTVTIGGITTPDKTYDGTAFEPIGTITVTGGSVPISELVWNYKSTDSGPYYNVTAPTNAGAYELTISVPDSNANYMGSKAFAFTIEKRQITLTADNKSVNKGGSLPELTFTAGNLAPGKTKTDALSAEPTLGCPTFDANTLGNCPITLIGGTATDNYTITTRADGVLTVAEQTYTVTFNPNGGTRTGGGDLTQIVAKGGAAIAPTLSRSNHTFTGWDKPFDNVTANLAVTANWSYNGGGGGSGGGGSNTPATLTYNVYVKAGNGAETIFPAKVNKDNRNATVDTGSQKLTSGETVITIPSIPDIGTYSVEIPVPELSTTEVQSTLTFVTHTGSVTVPLNMLTDVEGISGDKAEISIGQGDKENLPDDVKAAIEDKPLIQLTLSIDGKQTDWSNPSAPVTVSIPYTPTAAELANPESIIIWYIDGSGKAVSVPNGRYDPATGTVAFFTTHFSDYAVAYVHKTFSDLGGAEWARKAIEVMASKGITSGTGDGTFFPGINITRADYMVLLINALGIAADITENFDDVKPGAYCYSAVGAAKKLGIAAGSGNNRFNPTESISRQDMMVLAARALEKYQGLKAAGNNTVLEQFSDRGDIAEYAAGSLAALVDAGLIEGSGNKLNPRSYTTRAEAVVFLYNIYNEYTEAPVITGSTLSRLADQSRINTALSVAKTYQDKVPMLF